MATALHAPLARKNSRSSNRERSRRRRKRRRLQFVKILPANKKQIKADQRQMKLPSRGYTTLKCTFASNTHSRIHLFVRSLTRSLIQSVNHSCRSDSERVTINLFSHWFLPLLFAVLLSSFAAANFRLKLIERPTR